LHFETNNVNLRRALAGCLLLAATITATNIHAMELELAGGYTFQRSGGFTNGDSCGRNTICSDLHNAGVINANLITNTNSLLHTEWSVGYIFGQHKNPDNHWNNDDPTTYLGVGKRLGWHGLMLGLGIVLIDRVSQRLSSSLNFKTQLGFQYSYFEAMVQHISNGGLKQPNDGESFFTLGLCLGL
jgi:hypothetical protein